MQHVQSIQREKVPKGIAQSDGMAQRMHAGSLRQMTHGNDAREENGEGEDQISVKRNLNLMEAFKTVVPGKIHIHDYNMTHVQTFASNDDNLEIEGQQE